MDSVLSRRVFLAVTPVAAWISAAREAAAQPPAAASDAPASFPSHDPALVREIVGASHGNIARVRELLTLRPALAKASWDWGYGDWEDALGAASHVGNRAIAELLIADGARPSIFSAAMLGHLDAVKAFIAAAPGTQRIHGPHGITLLAHARAGGAAAAPVVAYLEALGDADRGYATQPLTEADLAAIAGTYVFGSSAADRLILARTPKGFLTIKREGAAFDRPLLHLGDRLFHPTGAPAVRIWFEGSAARAEVVTVEDGNVRVRGTRA